MIKEINMGYKIPNLTKIANVIIGLLKIESDVYIMPMKVKLDDTAFVTSNGKIHTIFITDEILKKDSLSDFNIKMLIHELTHVLQRDRGDLSSNADNTRIVWKGLTYTKNIPYQQRPFEIEARENERKYFKEIKQLLSL